MTVRLPRLGGNGERRGLGHRKVNTGRKIFFFVNKKEAKKTLIPLDRAG
jgi:hypothetical protein